MCTKIIIQKYKTSPWDSDSLVSVMSQNAWRHHKTPLITPNTNPCSSYDIKVEVQSRDKLFPAVLLEVDVTLSAVPSVSGSFIAKKMFNYNFIIVYNFIKLDFFFFNYLFWEVNLVMGNLFIVIHMNNHVNVKLGKRIHQYANEKSWDQTQIHHQSLTPFN